MSHRIDYRVVSPDGYRGFGRLHHYLAASGLESTLIELVYLRVSQMNRCAGNAARVHGQRTCRPHLRHRFDQRLQSPWHRLSAGSGVCAMSMQRARAKPAPSPSIEGRPTFRLRLLLAAPHVKR